MKISIVTAVRNRANVISGALQSVASQDYPDVEHILQDGASTDQTRQVIRRFGAPGVKLFSERDTGIYDGINNGLARTNGEIVGLLHSDDIFASNQVLSWVAEAFEDPEINAVYGDLQYLRGTRVLRHWRAGSFSAMALRRGWMPPHPTLFLRKEVMDWLGSYDTDFRISADYEAILRWFSSDQINAAYLPRVLVHMQAGGASNGSLGKFLRKSIEDYRAIRRHHVGGGGTLLAKKINKIPQYWSKPQRMVS